jgi:hypothetical protein
VVAGCLSGGLAEAFLVGLVEMGLHGGKVPLVGRKVSPVSDGKGEEACLFKHGESSTDGGGFRDRVIAADGEAHTFKEVGPDMFYGVFGIPYGIEVLLVVI